VHSNTVDNVASWSVIYFEGSSILSGLSHYIQLSINCWLQIGFGICRLWINSIGMFRMMIRYILISPCVFSFFAISAQQSFRFSLRNFDILLLSGG